MECYEYTKKFKRLIAKERNAEIEFHTNEIKTLSGINRERKGRALVDMQRQANPKLESESIFRFVKSDGGKLPTNEFSIGGNVLVSRGRPLDGNLKGSVISKSAHHIDIYILSQSNILFSKSLRVDIFVNDTTYKAQNEVLDGLHGWSFDKGDIRDILLHTRRPTLEKGSDIEFFDDSLNPSQKLAVQYSLREKEFYLIQGPPGTGKTKTSVEIIRQHLKSGNKILVSADSNVAVDNIMLGLINNIDVIRIGESPKILPEIEEFTFRHIIQRDIQYRIVQDGLDRIKGLREEQRKNLFPNKNNSKGLSYFQIKKLAERGKADFGISYDNLKSMAKWIRSQEEIKSLQSRVDKINEKIIKGLIDNASVICTTNTNAKIKYLDHVDFDLVLIDEAGQSTEPSCLIPISKAKKIILVGDHKQLPPTILSQDAQELSFSLFERMMTNSRFTLLDTQYRMHPLINEFPSKEFYDSQLESDVSTEKNQLDDRVFEKNVVFIESFGDEKKHKGATSYYNPDEVDKVFDLVVKYTEKGLLGDDIGIISPYSQQVKKIKERMPAIEVKSIDGFQGREKTVIIISLTRSNKNGNIGFLKDLRRLNVALTRAIKELVVIGNPQTISSEPVYKRFLDFVKEKGTYVKFDGKSK